jgi:hypothetical protein
MQSFVLVSFVGTLALLAAHVADYAVEIMRRPATPPVAIDSSFMTIC